MSNMGNYELEDIVWELSDNDDHIVPYTGDKKGYAVGRDKFSQSRIELNCCESNVESDSGIASGNTNGRKEEASLEAGKEDKKAMLGKSIWAPSSNDEGIPTPGFSTSKGKSVDSKFCTDNPVNDQAFTSDNSLKQYQLTDANCTENDLAFLRNGLEDKGGEDLLFYGWPELENFEDVDNMLRDCDPTFSLDIDNCGDLSWLSSSQTIEGSNDALKSAFDFPGCDPCGLNLVSEQQEVHGRSNNGMAVNESNKNLTSGSCERELHKSIADTRSTVTESYGNESRAVHHIDTQSQIHGHASPLKHQNSAGGKRKSWSSGSGISFIQFDKLTEAGEDNQLLNSQHNFSPENHQQQETSRPWLQTPKPVIKNNHQSSDCVLPSSTPSTIKSKAGVLPKMPPRESSHASNNMQSGESSRDISFQNITESKKGKLHQRKLSRHAEKSTLRAQRFDSDTKPITSGENEVGQRKVDGYEIGSSGELNSSTIQESSCLSSVMDEPAFDASSLKQLQLVMGQLDIRTKLCIRDSLYRLARSAAQRHKCDNQSNGGGDERDANGALLSGTNKSTGFIDMETDTNPIDRSIAHLLFHRPSDPSASPPVDAVAMKSHIMADAPSPSKADKSVSREETTLVNQNDTEHRN